MPQEPLTPLVVVIGAGASRGAGGWRKRGIYYKGLPGSKLRPPLTLDLFDEDEYRDVLRKYDLAHQAGRFITEHLGQDSTLGLEHALHSLASAPFLHQKHMALAVPPYLQHLLHEVSSDRYTEVLHYDRLIERLLRLDYVLFVSLNYDVLLDRRLHGHSALNSLGSYTAGGRNWSLIKPHGSVNWMHPTSEQYVPSRPPEDLTWDEEVFQIFPPDASLLDIRPSTFGVGMIGQEATNLCASYPALAAPEGPDDTLVLPSEHRSFFAAALQQAAQVDLLVIGYSGLDKAVPEFIATHARRVRRITIVDQATDSAEAVLRRLNESGLEPIWTTLAAADFAAWATDGGLNQLVDGYGGRY